MGIVCRLMRTLRSSWLDNHPLYFLLSSFFESLALARMRSGRLATRNLGSAIDLASGLWGCKCLMRRREGLLLQVCLRNGLVFEYNSPDLLSYLRRLVDIVVSLVSHTVRETWLRRLDQENS